MAPARRRNSSPPTPKPSAEKVMVDEFLDEVATEMFETISRIEEKPERETSAEPETKATPTIIESIIPTEDLGPRFIEVTAEKVAEVTKNPPTPRTTATPQVPPSPQVTTTPQLTPPPKRHPRNIPKFSAYKTR
jgi:hypothetical protein